MANMLRKLGELVYTPGTPSTPYRPAYCLEEPISSTDAARLPGRYSSDGTLSDEAVTWGAAWPTQTPEPSGTYSFGDVEITEWSSGNTSSGSSMSRYESTKIVCYPEVLGVVGTPAKFEREDRVGWDGAARSINSFDNDGYTSFRINTKPNGIIVGLARADTGATIADVTHGVYAHGSTIQIIESGGIVTTTGVSPATSPRIVVKRQGGYVDYFVGDWHYRSTVRSGGTAFLDATLYTTSDRVFDPVISSDVTELTVNSNGGADMSSPALVLFAGEGDGSSVAVSFSALEFEVTSTLSGMSRAETFLPAMTMFSGEGAGATSVLSISPLTIESYYGGLTPIVGGVDVVLAPLNGAARGMTGVVGGVERSLPALVGLASDQIYGAAELSLGSLSTYSDDGPPEGTYGIMQYAYAVDFVVIQPAFFATITERLELQEAEAIVVLSFVGSVFEGLAFNESITLTQMLQAIAEERLVVNSSTRQSSLEAIQYAVNVANGALTTYQGFNFLGFVKVDETTYGYRADGLYKIRPGDDDGVGINALIDFGVVPMNRDEDASPMRKSHLQDAFLGLSTDGTVYMKITADKGIERVYRVTGRGDAARSKLGKGITAREWRIKLEIVDATDAALDGIEYVAPITTRRWTR